MPTQPTQDASPVLMVVPATRIHLRARHVDPADDDFNAPPGACIQTTFEAVNHRGPDSLWDDVAALARSWATLHRGGLAHQATHVIDVAVDRHQGGTWRGTLADPETMLDLTGAALHDRAYRAMYGTERPSAPGEGAAR